METSWKRSCLGALHLAYSEAILNKCKFKVAKDGEKMFEVAKNTWAVYSTGTINPNQICPNQNSVKSRLIQSGETIMVDPLMLHLHHGICHLY